MYLPGWSSLPTLLPAIGRTEHLVVHVPGSCRVTATRFTCWTRKFQMQTPGQRAYLRLATRKCVISATECPEKSTLTQSLSVFRVKRPSILDSQEEQIDFRSGCGS